MNEFEMVDYEVKIRKNLPISEDFYLLTFEWRSEWGVPLPGQFLELRVDNSTAPLLRRPFAFSGYDAQAGEASMIYQRRGSSTQQLAKKSEGDSVKVLAPLGGAFGVTGEYRSLIAVAGGVGLGPILFAAKDAMQRGIPVKFVAGFRSADLVPKDIVWDGLPVTVCTDDGSVGFKGTTADYLASLSKDEIDGATVIGCGPTPMLKALHQFSLQSNNSCEVSMEELMACGIGVCMGCVIEGASGELIRVCKEGPVFDSRSLAWR